MSFHGGEPKSNWALRRSWALHRLGDSMRDLPTALALTLALGAAPVAPNEPWAAGRKPWIRRIMYDL